MAIVIYVAQVVDLCPCPSYSSPRIRSDEYWLRNELSINFRAVYANQPTTLSTLAKTSNLIEASQPYHPNRLLRPVMLIQTCLRCLRNIKMGALLAVWGFFPKYNTLNSRQKYGKQPKHLIDTC